jgi:superfamily II DNA or RNA helicase
MKPVNSSYRKELSEDQIIHQCNLVHIAGRYGYKNEESLSIRDLAIELLQGNILPDAPISIALNKHTEVLNVFIKHLEQTLKPIFYGISRHWRKTQDEALRANIKCFSRGYIRLLSEIPGGAGKSMLIGAFVRAALDTMKELGIDQEIHILTSRISIAGQLILEDLPTEDSQGDRPLEMGKKGDVRLWCPELEEKDIRLLAGKVGQSKKELEKDSKITVSTYQGLTPSRMTTHFKKPVFITLCDESHRVTERVAMLLDQTKSIVSGFSATVLGPDRDPFFFFERIQRPELMPEDKKLSYTHHLAYHKSIAEMVKDQELKAIRWINSKNLRIDVSEAKINSRKGIYDIFNDKSVCELLCKNPNLLAEVISEAYLGEHAGLTLSGSKPVWQRRGIAYVNRVDIAKKTAEECNKLLCEQIREKHGEDAYFKAGYVDGKMKEGEYQAIIKDFWSGKITLLFSVEKIGEGNDFPFVNLIMPLRVLGLGSQWILVQEILRGGRINPKDPTDDLVVLDMVFTSENHLLASVLGIFGRSALISGGLLVGWHSNYESEKQVFDLIMKYKSDWSKIWAVMTREQRVLFPFIEKKMLEEKARSSGSYRPEVGVDKNYVPMFSLGGISFVEDEHVKLALSLGNHKQLVEHVKETLTKEGLTSIDSLRNLQNMSLTAFAKNRHGSFRDGLTMVNLVLKESNSTLTPTKMTAFMELLRKSGFPVNRSNRSYEFNLVKRLDGNQSDKKQLPSAVPQHKKTTSEKATTIVAPKKVVPEVVYSVASLAEYTQRMFGVEAEFTASPRDLYGKKPAFVGMGTIQLPEGLSITSEIYTSDTEVQSNESAAAEIGKKIEWNMKKKQLQLYEGSRLYQNYLKIVPLVLHEYNFSGPFYTVTDRNGVYVVQAYIEKHGFKITGNPSINKDQKLAHSHANVSLAHKVLKNLAVSADVDPKTIYIDKLRALCESVPANIQLEERKIVVKDTTIYEIRLKAVGIDESGFGIFHLHAKEKAAENLYKELVNRGYPRGNKN